MTIVGFLLLSATIIWFLSLGIRARDPLWMVLGLVALVVVLNDADPSLGARDDSPGWFMLMGRWLCTSSCAKADQGMHVFPDFVFLGRLLQLPE